MSITPKQLDLLHHTLGLRPDRREPFRNHFMAGPGHHDQPDLEALEAAGLMVRRAPPSFCDASDVLFRVTEAGQALAIERLPHPPKRTKYQDYYYSETSLSFAEWLGIEVPKREYNYWVSRSDPRYDSVRLKSSKATGGWCKTLKEAKVSYKDALKSSSPHAMRWA